MEATLKFNLPEECEEFALASRAGDLCRVILELEEFLRRKVQDGQHDYETADEALAAVWNCLQDTDWYKFDT